MSRTRSIKNCLIAFFGHQKIIIHCGHIYHIECLYPWFSLRPDAPICPTCREPFNPSTQRGSCTAAKPITRESIAAAEAAEATAEATEAVAEATALNFVRGWRKWSSNYADRGRQLWRLGSDGDQPAGWSP